jgi:hypothetical protein
LNYGWAGPSPAMTRVGGIGQHRCDECAMTSRPETIWAVQGL